MTFIGINSQPGSPDFLWRVRTKSDLLSVELMLRKLQAIPEPQSSMSTNTKGSDYWPIWWRQIRSLGQAPQRTGWTGLSHRRPVFRARWTSLCSTCGRSDQGV